MEISGEDDVDAVRQALIKLMAIADRLETRNTQSVERIEAAGEALIQGAERLDGAGEQFARSALQVIGSHAQQAIAQSAEEALGGFRQQLQQSAEGARAAAQVMEQQIRGLARLKRGLVWSGMVALLVGSLLAAGGAAWVAHRSMQELARADFGKDILQATQRGTITRCGDELCVKVGTKLRRYGESGQYVLLQN